MEKASPKMEQVDSPDPKAVGPTPYCLCWVWKLVGMAQVLTYLLQWGQDSLGEGDLAGKETGRKEGNMMWEGCGQEVTIPGVFPFSFSFPFSGLTLGQCGVNSFQHGWPSSE
jgi:hypothetical protein